MDFFFVSDKRDSNAHDSGSTGAPDPVNIIFRYSWNIIIDHMGQITYIKPPCCYICCHEYADFTILEFFECPCSERLALIAMQGGSTDVFGYQFFSKLVCSVFCTDKDQGLCPAAFGN
jgi:hypothetical protein